MYSRAWYKGFLTKKEYEVLNLQKKGISQNEIAQRLNISQPQVSQIQRTIEEKVRRSKETIEITGRERTNLPRKKRNPDETAVFRKIVRERVRKNVKYGDTVVEIEPW
jgi:DNA-binding CsgD family transcriptional regulator